MDTDAELERINRQLEAKGAKEACLACGGLDLVIDPTAETALLAMNDRNVEFETAIEAVAVVCSRCGFVRLHSTLQLFDDE